MVAPQPVVEAAVAYLVAEVVVVLDSTDSRIVGDSPTSCTVNRVADYSSRYMLEEVEGNHTVALVEFRSSLNRAYPVVAQCH